MIGSDERRCPPGVRVSLKNDDDSGIQRGNETRQEGKRQHKEGGRRLIPPLVVCHDSRVIVMYLFFMIRCRCIM